MIEYTIVSGQIRVSSEAEDVMMNLGRRYAMEKKWMDKLVDMIFRGVLGLVVVYVMQLVCIHQNLPVLVGINMGVFSVIAILGIPGFVLVFAIGLIGIY